MNNELKYGIEDVQPALILAIESGETIFKQFKDGFQPFEDLLALLNTGTKLQAMLKNKQAIAAQFLDIDTEEGQQLNKAIAAHFKWTAEKAARRIKAGFNLIWAIIYFGDEWNEPEDGGEVTGGK